MYLNRPNAHTILKEIGDGNCLFRCFSHIITGSPDYHYEVRLLIIRHMRQISHLLVGSMLTEVGEDIEAYISDNKMDVLGSYGTSNEMVALSHLLLCNIYSFDADFAFSWSFMANPGAIDPSIPNIVERKSMYIYWRNGNHFEVLTSQLE